jgi:hypothetical protein
MPILEIGGQRVEVGDEFLQLKPEEQQQTVNEIAGKIGITPARTAAITPGQVQREEDIAKVAEQRSVSPEVAKFTDPAKAFGYGVANTLGFNIPSHLIAGAEYLGSDKSYKEIYEKQKAYEKALERLNPGAATTGTLVGAGLGLVTPGGAALAAPALAAKAAAAARYGVGAGRAAEIAAAGATGAGVAGASRAIETMDPLSKDTAEAALLGAGMGAAAQYALPKIANMFQKKDVFFDQAGNLTGKGSEYLEQAFGKTFTPEEIQTLKPFLEKEAAKLGASPEAARQALLKEQGIEAPTRSMVTGEKPLPAAAEVAEAGAAKAEDILSRKAEQLAGQPPERSAIAEALTQKGISDAEAASRQFEKSKRIPGDVSEEFRMAKVGPGGPGKIPEIEPPIVMQRIQETLQQKGVPTTFEATEAYPQAAKALKYLENNLLAGNYPYGGKLNMKNIEAIHQDLNDFWFAARGTAKDQRAVSAITDGYEKAVKEALIDPALFTGDGAKAIKEVEKARKMWKDMKDTFYSPYGAAKNDFNKTMAALVDQSTGRLSENLQQGAYDTAQAAINAGLINRQSGSAFYDRLERALGKNSESMQMVRDQVRATALNAGTRADGKPNLQGLPKKIDDFLATHPDLAQKVFTGQNGQPSITDLKKLSSSLKIINGYKVPNEQKENMAVKAASNISSMMIGLLSAQAKGPVAGFLAYEGSEAARAAGRGLLGFQKRAVESAGAPKYKPESEWIKGRSIRPSANPVEAGFAQPSNLPFVPRNISREEETGYGPPTELPPLTIPGPGNRPGRARGGRISDQLMADVERAKKQINNKTKVLLNADDNHVAKALEIANQNSEG